MGLRIHTNVESLSSQRHLSQTVSENNMAMEKLSSGMRINRASDDAAGLAVSEHIRANLRGMVVAKRNATDGISLLQTAEGGLNEVSNILVRLRELSVQGASDTISDTERSFLNKEYVQLKDEITRIAKSTEFNGSLLLAGDGDGLEESLKSRISQTPLDVQVGIGFSPDVDGPQARNPVNSIRIDFKNLDASIGEKGLNIGNLQDPNLITNVATKLTSQESLTRLDAALSKVADYRSTIGSVQNRLISTVNNLGIQMENLGAANSRIRDTDFAEETAKFVQTNIIKQAGVSMLAQANANPQLALKLLG